MAANEIHKGDEGTQFKITMYEGTSVKDISYATVAKEVIFKKPSGTVVTQTGSFFTDGTDGILTYTSTDGDLDEVGHWKIQVRLAGVSSDRRTDIGTFMVHENLE